CLGLIAQALTHSVQYHFAVNNQKQVEAETAIALLAFAKDDIDLLKLTSRDPFIVGYWLWSRNQHEEAIQYLNRAIGEGKYVASSNYLLAVFFSEDGQGTLKNDFSKCYKYLERALANNPGYAPAHYLLAQLYANANRITDALETLPKAVMPDRIGRMPCMDLN